MSCNWPLDSQSREPKVESPWLCHVCSHLQSYLLVAVPCLLSFAELSSCGCAMSALVCRAIFLWLCHVCSCLQSYLLAAVPCLLSFAELSSCGCAMSALICRPIFLWLCSKDLEKIEFENVAKDSPEEILMNLRNGQTTYAVVFEILCRCVVVLKHSSLSSCIN